MKIHHVHYRQRMRQAINHNGIWQGRIFAKDTSGKIHNMGTWNIYRMSQLSDIETNYGYKIVYTRQEVIDPSYY